MRAMPFRDTMASSKGAHAPEVATFLQYIHLLSWQKAGECVRFTFSLAAKTKLHSCHLRVLGIIHSIDPIQLSQSSPARPDTLPTPPLNHQRYMRFGPDNLLYVSIGAPCNACKENSSPTGLLYASIYSLDVTAGNTTAYATDSDAVDDSYKLYARGDWGLVPCPELHGSGGCFRHGFRVFRGCEEERI